MRLRKGTIGSKAEKPEDWEAFPSSKGGTQENDEHVQGQSSDGQMCADKPSRKRGQGAPYLTPSGPA